MTSDPRVVKSRQEIEANFLHAFDALKLSSQAYDDGFLGEAARLASTIHLFVHDYGTKAVSLLTHVGRKAQIRFINSARPIDPRNLLTEAPLITISVGAEAASTPYRPRFNVPPELPSEPSLSFSKWWEQDVLRDSKRRLFTRKNLVLSMRDKEGGGHVDHKLDEAFAGLQRHQTAGWTVIIGDQAVVPKVGPVHASVRQIAWELEITLRLQCEDLIKSAKMF